MSEQQPMIWLVWAVRKNGLVELRSVSLTREHADVALTYVRKNEPPAFRPQLELERTWIEERRANHIYGASMASEMMALAAKTKPR